MTHTVKIAALYAGQEVALAGDREPCTVVRRTGNGVYEVNRRGRTVEVTRNRLAVKWANCGRIEWRTGPVNEKLEA